MKRLMTHVVAGYPDLQTTKRLIKDMVERKIAAIEIQIPFSDPIADGPVLMAANDRAVAQGIGARDVLRLVREFSGGVTRIYVMTYFQPVLHYGSDNFFRDFVEAGCAGFIIPDLPFDAPEMKLKQLIVPVLSPGMQDDRLKEIFKTLQPQTIYLTARHGITGEHTKVAPDLEKIVQKIRKLSSGQLAIGFGVQTPDDVKQILKIADLAVVGSVITQRLAQSTESALSLIQELGG